MLRRLHGLSALFLLLFLTAHITNHLAALGGVESHIRIMKALRLVYRMPIVETFLLLAVCFQIASGLTFVIRGWRERRGFLPWLQAGSGLYLVFFFLNHVSAVLFGRAILHLDTNFYFAAAGFFAPPFQYFFAPYYFLGTLALFVHLGCALYWQFERTSETAAVLAILLPSTLGLVIALTIVLSLAGMFYPVDIPQAYRATYGH